MLGMSADTTLYGCLSDCGLYSGYISVSSMKNTPVYIVSNTKPPEQFSGRIIAMIHGENESRIIVAPQGQVFYQ